MKQPNKEQAMIILAAIIFISLLFGMAGFRLAALIFLMYILPFYMILGLFDLSDSEKVIFSFMLGLGIIPSLVYYLGFVFSSLRKAILFTLVLMFVISFVLRKLMKKK